MPLPINIHDLLHGETVESERLELKSGWNPESVLHTLCAFANDFHNLGGGYIVLGVAERDGTPLLPPEGLTREAIDRIQKDLLNLGNSAIQPPYHAVAEPYTIDGRHILVLWARGGRVENFPYSALEEALVNAVYHRSYEEREPIEVRISPEELVVVSYPGPDRSVRLSDLRRGKAIPRRYRSRRIGELLKELGLTEGRGTGIPKILRAMKANGSPAAKFEFDEDHSYFITRLPVHPKAAREPQVTPQVTPQVGRLLVGLSGEMTRSEIMAVMGLKDRMHFAREYLERALEVGLIEMTIPDKPNSRLQRYRITEAGRAWLAARQAS